MSNLSWLIILLNAFAEFLLGEDILVAPVLVEGATSRDIYLPAGFWKDENMKSDVVLKGPTWLKNYNAGLDILPYFRRISADKIVAAPAVIESSNYNPVQAFAIISIIIPLSLVVYIARRMRRRCLKTKRHVRL